jgi:hypothetical protein
LNHGAQEGLAGCGGAPARDLTQGVIVVLSGGGFDAMNPVEVRNRMDQYITDVNGDRSSRRTPAARV